jgi:hypothetical protein
MESRDVTVNPVVNINLEEQSLVESRQKSKRAPLSHPEREEIIKHPTI